MKFNPFSSIQPVQRTPLGVSDSTAQLFQQQQQAQQEPDQSQFSDYIRQLQDSGASNEQIQAIVQQMQSGNTPPVNPVGSNVPMGTDQSPMESGQSQLSQILNKLAAGKGDINYDQLSSAYPTPRAPIVQDKQQLISNALMGNKDMSGTGVGGLIGQATASANQQQAAQRQAYQDELNKRDLGAYMANIGIAEKSGGLQSQARQAENLEKYRGEQIGLERQKMNMENLTPLGMDAEGNTVLFDRKTGNTKVVPNVTLGRGGAGGKPLSGVAEAQLRLGLDHLLGVRDAKGNIKDEEADIDPTQKNAILSAAEVYLQQNPMVGYQGAIGHVINEKLGGVDTIQDAESKWFGKDTPRMFPADKISGLSSKAPNVMPNEAPDNIQEGRIAKNPKTGERLKFTNGEWVPIK